MTAPKLRVVYVRLFEDDMQAIQRFADTKRAPLQVELRMLVHEAVAQRLKARPKGETIIR